MALTTSIITGRVPLPNSDPAVAGEVVFTLNAFDTEGAEVVLPASVRAVLTPSGDLPAGFDLWRNTEGLRGTYYIVTAKWTEQTRDSGRVQREAVLGRIQVHDLPTYTISNLLNSDVDPATTSYWMAISQQAYDDFMAAAVSTLTNAQRAEAAAAAAATGANYFDTIALGRAAVANGQTFGVLAGGADGLTRPTLFRRNSATTQTEIIQMVSFPEFRAAAVFETTGIGGTADAVTATCSITPAIGDMIWVTPTATSAGTVTLSINGGAALSVRDLARINLAPGQFREGVRYLLWRYASSAYAIVAPTVSRYVRAQAGGSINEMISDGTYIATGAFTDGPTDFTASAALVDVTTFGQNFAMQIMRETGNGGGFWHRVIRPGISTFGTWTNIGTGGGGGGGGSTYAGKRAVFLGDSITENHTWPLEAASALGLGTSVKGGFGGSRLSQIASGGLHGMCGVDVADAIASGNWAPMEAEAERLFLDNGDDNRAIVAGLKAVNWSQISFIVGFWGTNDFNNSVPLGTAGDTNRTTIRGSVNYFMERVCSAYPQIQMLWVAPMFRARQAVGDGKDSDNFPNPAGTYLVEYGDAIRSEAGDKWHMPGLDLYRESGINLSNYAAYLSAQTIDGLHPREPLGNDRVKNMIVAGFRRYL